MNSELNARQNFSTEGLGKLWKKDKKQINTKKGAFWQTDIGENVKTILFDENDQLLDLNPPTNQQIFKALKANNFENPTFLSELIKKQLLKNATRGGYRYDIKPEHAVLLGLFLTYIAKGHHPHDAQVEIIGMIKDSSLQDYFTDEAVNVLIPDFQFYADSPWLKLPIPAVKQNDKYLNPNSTANKQASPQHNKQKDEENNIALIEDPTKRSLEMLKNLNKFIQKAESWDVDRLKQLMKDIHPGFETISAKDVPYEIREIITTIHLVHNGKGPSEVDDELSKREFRRLIETPIRYLDKYPKIKNLSELTQAFINKLQAEYNAHKRKGASK